MADDTTADTPTYTTLDLRRMDEAEARRTLPVAEYERWQKLHDLDEGYRETKARWADEDATVSDIVVHADPEQLGTRVNLYGNDVLVSVDPEDERLRQAARALDEEYGGLDYEDVDELGDVDADRLAGLFADLLDAVIVRWEDHDWADLSPGDRQDVREQWREKWKLEGLIMAKVDVMAAVEEERGEKMDVIESFRTTERRRRH